MNEPQITRNIIYQWSRGRYEIRYCGWTQWAMTKAGARHAARRLKKLVDSHGEVIDPA